MMMRCGQVDQAPPAAWEPLLLDKGEVASRSPDGSAQRWGAHDDPAAGLPPCTWEGVFLVPDLKLERCPWRRKESDGYYVVVFEGRAHDGQIMSEPCCERCAGTATEYIEMRKHGLKRLEVLRDFGIRQ